MLKSPPFFIIGNWKSHKTIKEAVMWWQDFSAFWKKSPVNPGKIKVILCPGFIHLTILKSLITLSKIPVFLGVQDISPFKEGAFTGEIAASTVSDLVSYALIGHSERRKLFAEKRGELVREIEQARINNIQPIYCVQNEDMLIPHGCQFVGYEPVWAIGSGKPETPENADQAAKNLLKKQEQDKQIKIIYGGSVTPENVTGYRMTKYISGVLPGGASLKPDTFFNLIKNCENA